MEEKGGIFSNFIIIIFPNLVFTLLHLIIGLILFIGISFKHTASFSYWFTPSVLRPDTVLTFFRFFLFHVSRGTAVYVFTIIFSMWLLKFHLVMVSDGMVVFKNKISDAIKFFHLFEILFVVLNLLKIKMKNTIFTYSKIVKINYFSSFIFRLISYMFIIYTGAGVRAACAVFIRPFTILKMFKMTIFIIVRLSTYSCCVCMLTSLVLSASEFRCESDFKVVYFL